MKLGGHHSAARRALASALTRAQWADPEIRAKRMRGILANPGGLQRRLYGLSAEQLGEYRRLRKLGVPRKRAKELATGEG